MGCRKLTYRSEGSRLKVVSNNLKTNAKCRVGLYRYGFQGQEKDDEIKGEGNSYDFGARLYDPRVGRWASTDKVIKPPFSPYLFGNNNPVIFVDPDGNDEFYFLHNYAWYIASKNYSQLWDFPHFYNIPNPDYVENSKTHSYFYLKDYTEKVNYNKSSSIILNSKDSRINEFRVNYHVEEVKQTLEDGERIEVTDPNSGGKVYIKVITKTPNFIQINSPMTIQGGDASKKGFDSYTTIDPDKAREQIDSWKSKNWKNGTYTNFVLFGGVMDLMADSHNGQELDFKSQFDLKDNVLYEINGVYYNKNEAGNFYYGYALASMGFSWGDAKFIAHQGTIELTGSRSFDEPWELDAIRDGWDYHNQSNHESNIEMYEKP